MSITQVLKPAAVCLSISLVLTGCRSGGSTSATDAGTLLTAMQKQINSSCSTSGVQKCLTERLGYAYPGSLDADKSRACIAALEEDPKFQYNVSFDTASLTAVTGWTAPVDDKAADWRFAGQLPAGTVFAVKLREIVVAHGIESTNNIEGHVAVKDGSVYWFPSFCTA